MKKLLATCVCLPCSPWSADTENSLSLLLSLLHTDRIENRGRGLELNPNIPPEPSPSCAEVQPLSATDKIKKRERISSFCSSFFLFITHLVCLLSYSFKVFPPTSTSLLLFSTLCWQCGSTAGWISMQFILKIHVPLRFNLNDFDHLLSSGQYFNL